MSRRYTQLTFTPGVKQLQSELGSRESAAQVEAWNIDDEHLSMREAAFISQRDSFYMATVTEEGWPYVQFRGGLPGFLRVINNNTLGYADLRGNRQYISLGNLGQNDRAALFFMNYGAQQRLKIMATSEVLRPEEHPELLEQLAGADEPSKVERLVLFHIEAFEWNCPKYITPRFTAEEWQAMQDTQDQRDPS
jgi:predicted pyridoxine 5'-phosphate oxidase superfamily flavin-nucleotide-binding protein